MENYLRARGNSRKARTDQNKNVVQICREIDIKHKLVVSKDTMRHLLAAAEFYTPVPRVK